MKRLLLAAIFLAAIACRDAATQAATGSITGTVTATSIEGETLPFENAAISVYRETGDDPPPGLPTWLPVATGRSGPTGQYTVESLPPGMYEVAAAEPAFAERFALKFDVLVSVGGRTSVDLPMVINTTVTVR
jgi:hypothetical protein